MTATYVVTWAAAPGRKMQRQQYRCSFGAGDLRLELGGDNHVATAKIENLLDLRGKDEKEEI
jgi:hypothetical protein